MIKTNPDYWDCECENLYIHSKYVKKCNGCGAKKTDQPDSRVNEVIFFKQEGRVK